VRATPIVRLPRYSHLRPPPEPVLQAGLCTRHHDPGLWTATGRAQREAACNICRACPVLALCRAWAVAAVPSSDGAVYAATGPAERARLRRAAQAGAA
jgi:hypothetical protein